MKIFIDQDGVVADFSGPAMIQWGARNWYEENPEIRGAEAWDIPENLGIEPKVFWEATNNYEFWVNLPVLEDGQLMVAEAMAIQGAEVYFLTAPTLSGDCLKGKYDWVARHFPEVGPERIIFTRYKHLLAMSDPDVLLVDDNERNIADFRAAGGEGFLMGRPWNRRWPLEKFNNELFRDWMAERPEVTSGW